MSDQTNPLLAGLKLPGRVFQLPSRGLFYKNGELADDITNGEIHVRPMSALDEINMKNPDQLFSGEAVNAVFKQCIDGINKPSQLLSKDVDAIMFFLRAVTYGPSYEFMAKHTCENAKDHSYVADTDQMINNIKQIDPTTLEESFTVTLTNGQVVKLAPSSYQQILDLIKTNENKTQLSAEDQKKNLTMMLQGVVIQVDQVTDKRHIAEWITKLTTPQVNQIAKKVDGMNDWGPNMIWKCKCRDCGSEFDVEIPINPVSFFTE